MVILAHRQSHVFKPDRGGNHKTGTFSIRGSSESQPTSSQAEENPSSNFSGIPATGIFHWAADLERMGSRCHSPQHQQQNPTNIVRLSCSVPVMTDMAIGIDCYWFFWVLHRKDGIQTKIQSNLFASWERSAYFLNIVLFKHWMDAVRFRRSILHFLCTKLAIIIAPNLDHFKKPVILLRWSLSRSHQ